MRTLKSLAFLAGLLPAVAAAQTNPFPQQLPANTVAGRLGTVAGPVEAIPFSVLSAALSGSYGAVAANKVLAGPTSGTPVVMAPRLLVGADLPVPSASTLGGVESLTCSTSNWFNTLSTSGIFGCSQPNFTDLAGSIAAGQIPAGTITNTMIAGAAAIALSKLASQSNNTIVGNNSGSSAAPSALNGAQVGAILCPPSRSVFTSGTNTTYTTPTCNSALPTRIELEMVGPGGGSSGSGSAPGAGGTPANGTCWNTSGTACTTPLYLAGAGAGASISNNTSASGGTTSSCDLGLTGGSGGFTSTTSGTLGGIGGGTPFGPGAPSGPVGGGGVTPPANTGAGASGPGFASAENGGGGAGGGYCRKLITSPASSYVYTVGVGGSAGSAGTSGAAGNAGAAGLIIATAYWQ